MTQPNQFLPVPAANYSSLAAFAAKTQEQWEAEMYGPFNVAVGQINEGLWDGLQAGGSYTLSLLGGLANTLLGLDSTTFYEDMQAAFEALEEAQHRIDAGYLAIAQMVDDTLGTGHDVGDLVQFWADGRDDLQRTWQELWGLVLDPAERTGDGLIDWSAALAKLHSIADQGRLNGHESLTRIATIVDTVLGSGHTALDLANFLIAGDNWLRGLVEDLTILIDIFHLTYPLGAVNDAHDRTINGKRTWYSAWNHLWGIHGAQQQAALPVAPVSDAKALLDDAQYTADAAGLVADFASGKAVTADTKATTGLSWLDSVLEDLTILFDVFHLTYPLGSVNDAVDRTIGGKRTWYAAWNRLWGVHNDSRNVPPGAAAAAPTVADAKAQLDAANQNTADLGAAVYSGLTGDESSPDREPSEVADAADGVRATLSDLQGQVQSIKVASSDSEFLQRIEDGGFPSGGHGGPVALGASWSGVNAQVLTRSSNGFTLTAPGSAARSGSVRYATALKTSYLSSVVVLNTRMQRWLGVAGSPAVDVATASAGDMSRYVFARVTHNTVQLGYRDGGVDTLIGSPVTTDPNGPGVSIELQADMFATSTYRVYRNGALLITQSLSLGWPAYRFTGFGLHSDVYAGVELLPAAVSFWARDRGTQTVKGSGIVVRRSISTSVPVTTGGAGSVNPVPAGFLSVVESKSADVTVGEDGDGWQTFTLGTAGFYIATFNLPMVYSGANVSAALLPALLVYLGGNEPRQVHAHGYLNATGSSYIVYLHASIAFYAPANTYVMPAVINSSLNHSWGGVAGGLYQWLTLTRCS